MLKYSIIKFKKSLLIQAHSHDIDKSYWEDSNMDRKLRFTRGELIQNGEIFTIYYNGELDVKDRYISLGLDFKNSVCNRVLLKSYESDEERDRFLELFIKSIKYFKERIQEYTYE